MSRKGKKQKKVNQTEREAEREAKRAAVKARLIAERQKDLAAYKVRLSAGEKRFVKTGKEDLPSEDRQENEEEATEAWVTSLMNQEPERPTKRKGTSNKGATFLISGA